MQRRLLWPLAALAVGLILYFAGRRGEPTSPAPSPKSTTEAPAASATVQVEVSLAGQPLPDAKVALVVGEDVIASGRSDGNGKTSLGPVAFGRFQLMVAHPSALMAQRPVEIAGAQVELRVNLERAAGLEITVRDPPGNPIAGAWVQVLRGDTTREAGRCETDARGSCSIGSLGPDSYRLHAASGRHRPTTGDLFEIERAGGVVRKTVVLELGRFISGRVLDDHGAPVAAASVGAGEGTAIATTDADGKFELGGLGDTPVNLFATAAGFAPRQLRGLRPGAANVRIDLERPATVSGQLDIEGEVKSVLVSVCHRDPHFEKEICIARTNVDPPQKVFRIEELPSGNFEVLIEADAHLPERVRVQLTAGAELKLAPVRVRRTP